MNKCPLSSPKASCKSSLRCDPARQGDASSYSDVLKSISEIHLSTFNPMKQAIIHEKLTSSHGFHLFPATRRLQSSKSIKSRRIPAVLHKLYVWCHTCCLSWHTIYFAGIYILCAWSDGRPWSQNSSKAVHQRHRHQIIAANGPELRVSHVLEGRARTAALRFARFHSVPGLNHQMWLWNTAQMFWPRE